MKQTPRSGNDSVVTNHHLSHESNFHRLKARQDQPVEPLDPIPTDWRPHWPHSEQRKVDALAKSILERSLQYPSSHIIATTHSINRRRFGSWETVDPNRPSSKLTHAHEALWTAYDQFFPRLAKEHANHWERKPEDKTPLAWAFIDDPSAKAGAKRDDHQYPHIHSTIIVRAEYANRYDVVDSHAAVKLRDPLEKLWMKCPDAHTLYVRDIPKDQEMIAAWVAYASKYAWKPRTQDLDDSQLWKVFG